MTTAKHPPAPAAKPAPQKDAAAAATKPGADPKAVVNKCPDGIVIVIDPGHGDNIGHGVDSGAVYPDPLPKAGGAMEKDLALKVSVALKAALDGKPHIKAVYLTRTADVTTAVVRFKWRTDVATAKDAQMFLCIHLNSAASTSATGHVAYYYPGPIAGESKKLCVSISSNYKAVPPRSSGGVISESHHIGIVKFGDPSPVKAATLIEVGFVSNATDRGTLDTNTAQVAKEIAAGVTAYIDANLAALCAP
jgi:N-acetylmuramoyl-L-alanine amidase